MLILLAITVFNFLRKLRTIFPLFRAEFTIAVRCGLAGATGATGKGTTGGGVFVVVVGATIGAGMGLVEGAFLLCNNSK